MIGPHPQPSQNRPKSVYWTTVRNRTERFRRMHVTVYPLTVCGGATTTRLSLGGRGAPVSTVNIVRIYVVLPDIPAPIPSADHLWYANSSSFPVPSRPSSHRRVLLLLHRPLLLYLYHLTINPPFSLTLNLPPSRRSNLKPVA